MHAALRLQSLGAVSLTGPDGELLPRRRKELALLVILAGRAPRPVRRDELTGLFWAESPEDRARHSLRQAVLRLRAAVGDALIVGHDDLAISDAVVFDVRVFSDLAAAARFTDAIDHWTGDFLPGLEDAGGEEFGTWVDFERERLRRQLDFCYQQAVLQFEHTQQWAEMVHWSRRWTEQFRFEERPHLRHIEALCRAGRGGEAEAVRTAFLRRLQDDLGDDASAEWLSETERLLSESRAAEVTAGSGRPAPLPVAAAPHAYQSPMASGAPQRPWRRALPLAFAAVLAAAVIFGIWRARQTTPPLLAIGHIASRGLPDSTAALPQLLAMGLGRAAGLHVLSETRMQDVLTQLQSSGDSAVDMQRAALAAGATEIIEGVLSQQASGEWRMDLRRTDLTTHEMRAVYRVESRDLFELVDLAAQHIAQDLHADAPARVAGATTSLAALQFYQEGLRAWYEGELIVARRMFAAALEEDSTFAMAAYYTARFHDLGDATKLLQHAVRMAPHASDRDRLFIMVNWLGHESEPAELAVAETLAVRYPFEPDAHQEYGQALVTAGRFAEAIQHYRRVIELDSLGLRGVNARCVGCDAYQAAVDAYRLADSLPAAQRLSREWIARQPESLNAWLTFFNVLAAEGRYAEALDALQTANRFDREQTIAASGNSDLWLRVGDIERTDRYWSDVLETGDTDRLAGALDVSVSSLRIQGRFNEALDAALRLRQLADYSPDAPVREAYQHATVLFDMGRFRESAVLFDSIARIPFDQSAARSGRHRAWMLTHAATGYAAAGDTARLRQLEQTIRVEGGRSSYRRDQLLHHYVRGLRLRLEGRSTEAVAAFRESLYSMIEGNSRATLELARTLLEVGHAADAITVLRAALAGPIGASGQYVNRTEVQYLLAHAFEGAGKADSAASQYRKVIDAWKRADPSMSRQRATAAARLAALRR